MKGMGIMELMAFVLAKREKLPCAKTWCWSSAAMKIRKPKRGGISNEASCLGTGSRLVVERRGFRLENGRLGGGHPGLRREGAPLASAGRRRESRPWFRTSRTKSLRYPAGRLVGSESPPTPFAVLPEMQTLLKNLGTGGIDPGGLGRPSPPSDPAPASHVPGHSEHHHAPGRFQAQRDPYPGQGYLGSAGTFPGRSLEAVKAEIKKLFLPAPFPLQAIQSFPASLSPVENEFFQCLENRQTIFSQGPFPARDFPRLHRFAVFSGSGNGLLWLDPGHAGGRRYRAYPRCGRTDPDQRFGTRNTGYLGDHPADGRRKTGAALTVIPIYAHWKRKEIYASGRDCFLVCIFPLLKNDKSLNRNRR